MYDISQRYADDIVTYCRKSQFFGLRLFCLLLIQKFLTNQDFSPFET